LPFVSSFDGNRYFPSLKHHVCLVSSSAAAKHYYAPDNISLYVFAMFNAPSLFYPPLPHKTTTTQQQTKQASTFRGPAGGKLTWPVFDLPSLSKTTTSPTVTTRTIPYHFPQWRRIADFLNDCDETDFTEAANVGGEENVMTVLRPLLDHNKPKDFTTMVKSLNSYETLKTDSQDEVQMQDQGLPSFTCLVQNQLPVSAPPPNYRPRIAFLQVGTKNNRNLFGDEHDDATRKAYKRAYALSIRDKEDYCERHGYNHYVFEKVVEDRLVGWYRIPALLSILAEYDWVFYLDLDTVILDHSIKLEEFLKPGPDVVMGMDRNGMNDGAFFIRNSTWSHLFLAEAWTITDEARIKGAHEQGAMRHLMENIVGIRNHMRLVKQDLFNTNPILPGQDDERAFIVHFAGYGKKWDKVIEYIPRRKHVLESS
jgi:hypothetical protein